MALFCHVSRSGTRRDKRFVPGCDTTDQKVRSGDLMMQLDDPFMRARLELIAHTVAGSKISAGV